MQQRDFIIKPGQQLEPESASFLAKYFNPVEIEAALKRGARLRLSLITPWPRTKKPNNDAIIAPGILAELESIVSRPEALEARLAEFSGPQILKIGGLLGIPMQKTAKVEGLRARLFGSLRSGTVWKSISGQATTNKPPAPALNDARPSEPT